jgi:hypothetical protein
VIAWLAAPIVMIHIHPTMAQASRVLGVLPLLLTGACADKVDSPPMNANISNTAGDVTLPLEVQCEGAPDDISQLGSLCGAKTMDLDWSDTDAPAGMATDVGSAQGPLLLIYDRLGYDPGSARNVAGELAYAAFISLRGSAKDSTTTLEEWKHAEPVTSGTVVTNEARFVACNESWYAQGTFTWRSVTLSLAWVAGQAC